MPTVCTLCKWWALLRVVEVKMLFRTRAISLAVVVFAALAACGQTVSDVVVFDNINSLAYPITRPAQGRDGKLYGTILGGGQSGGAIFDFTTSGVTTILDSLVNATGSGPALGVTLGTDGNLYGATTFGGTAKAGVLYRVSANGTYTVLHNFTGGTDGALPESIPFQASDGNFYGTTSGGFSLPSTVYKYNPHTGAFSTIYAFDQAHGVDANSVMQGSDGNLYATTFFGGATHGGTVVKLTTSGKLLSYYSFPAFKGDGNSPIGPLVESADGNLYGATLGGGSIGDGMIFRITPDLTVTDIYDFCGDCLGGFHPSALVLGSDGNLYGANESGGANFSGTLFRSSTAGKFNTLYSFNTSVGNQPEGGLTQDTNGLFYGSALTGGAYGYGAIYSLDMGLAPFISFVLPTGKVGQPAQILGQGLTGATGVTFNGIAAAKFTVVSDTYMTALVPAGATTGAVAVTTPTGTLTSNVNFRISK